MSEAVRCTGIFPLDYMTGLELARDYLLTYNTPNHINVWNTLGSNEYSLPLRKIASESRMSDGAVSEFLKRLLLIEAITKYMHKEPATYGLALGGKDFWKILRRYDPAYLQEIKSEHVFAILGTLCEYDSLSPKQISDLAGVEHGTVRSTLPDLKKANVIEKLDLGLYKPTEDTRKLFIDIVTLGNKWLTLNYEILTGDDLNV
jgi:hypothetical protein